MTTGSRFWSKVSAPSSLSDLDRCWNWQGAKNTWGYGNFYADGKYVRVHRWAWEQLYGPIPPGLVIDHLCRNRACVNVAHMEVVTHRENTRRGVGSAGQNSRKTECKRGHPFTEENTYRYTYRGRSIRQCRECRRLAMIPVNAKRSKYCTTAMQTETTAAGVRQASEAKGRKR